jgi:hypothetical protein
MANYIETATGKFKCVDCEKEFASKSSAGSHHWRAHSKRKKIKRKAAKTEPAPVQNEDGTKAHEVSAPVYKGAVERRIKFCPECGHEIPTGLVFE